MLFGRRGARRMEAACGKLLDATREVAPWHWDEQSGAALLTLESAQQGEVLARVKEIFPASWDQIDVGRAPEHVRHIAGSWGGLMAGQHLFVCDPDADPVVFALWMPWSNRLNTSLRVSCAAFDDAVARRKPRDGLRACMGLTDRAG